MRTIPLVVLALVLAACRDSATDPGPLDATEGGPSLVAAGYAFQAFDVPFDLGSGTSAFGINNAGTIVGNYLTAQFTIDGFVFNGQKFSDVTVPGSEPFNRGVLNAINIGGLAVGSFIDAASGVSRGFLRAKTGRITVLPDASPGMRFMDALGINQAGTVVGTYRDAAGVSHGFFYQNRSYTTFDHPGGIATNVEGINDAGVAVGYYVDGFHLLQGFMLSNGTPTPIAPPGSVMALPRAVNNFGVVVGTWWDGSFTAHGFLLKNGVFTTLDFPGAADTELLGINDRGVIVGSYDQFSRGLVAKPLP